MSAASCYEKAGDPSRATNLYQAALASPLSHRLSTLAEPIADAADRLDEVSRPELAAQGLDVDIDRAVQDDGPLADGRVHQLCPREGAARLTEQALQQAELRRRQVEFSALDGGP